MDSFVVEDFCGTDRSVEDDLQRQLHAEGEAGMASPPYFFDNYRYRQVWTDLSDPTRMVIHQGNGLWHKDHHITTCRRHDLPLRGHRSRAAIDMVDRRRLS